MIDSGSDEFPLPPEAGTPADDSPLRFIEGELRRPEIPLRYRVSLLIVSLATILLPLIYFAIIGFCCYGMYRYAVNYLAEIADWPFQSMQASVLMWLVCLTPFFLGIAFIFFLVKPLFAPRPRRDEPFSLNHADAPKLFTLIGWICRSLNAPIPSRVDVSHHVNASAEVRSILGNDVVLELGLSLAAGMNLSQFAGVIAHEYGHFSQSGAMRAYTLVRRINGWFYRAVYERDKWDFALIAISERENQSLLLVLIAWLARLGVWFGRRILWMLMWIGHALNGLLAREMEFNADQYEISFVGSETFVQGMRRARQLDLGMQAAMKRLRDNWEANGRLFDQIPDLVVSCANEISAEFQGRVHAAISRRGTRMFDQHPSDAERIERAVAAGQPGVFHPTVPATTLFANFPELARQATQIVYRNVLGHELTADSFIATEQAVRQSEHDSSVDEKILQRYFLEIPTGLRPIYIAENKTLAVRQPETLVAAIQSNRAKMNRLLPDAQTAYARLHEADARVLQAAQAAHLLRAGFQFDPADFNLAVSDLEHAQAVAARTMQAAAADLFPFEEAGRLRLADTVQLLHLCQAVTVIPDVPHLAKDARELVWVLSRLAPVAESLLELRQDCAALDTLLQYRRQSPADNLAAVLDDLCTGIQEHINSIQQQTGQIRYPFAHSAGQIMVSQYLRNTEFYADPCELALREATCCVEKSITLHQRLLASLVLICEEVERHAVP